MYHWNKYLLIVYIYSIKSKFDCMMKILHSESIHVLFYVCERNIKSVECQPYKIILRACSIKSLKANSAMLKEDINILYLEKHNEGESFL